MLFTASDGIKRYHTAYYQQPVSYGKADSDQLEPTMKNTGTEARQDRSHGYPHGATLLSRNPDFNSTFGTFLISPRQGQNTAPGETFTYRSALRAPSTPGTYTMVRQLADRDIPDEQYGSLNHKDATFFGLLRPGHDGQGRRTGTTCTRSPSSTCTG